MKSKLLFASVKILIGLFVLYLLYSYVVYPKNAASFFNELLGDPPDTTALVNKDNLQLICYTPENPSYTAANIFTQNQIHDTAAKDNSGNDFIEIINRDNGLPIPPTSYVQQNTKPDKKFSINLSEGDYYIGSGVVFRGFVTNGIVPGPTFIADEGDIVEFTVNNKGKLPHGASIHSAYTQTSKYLGKIPPGESRTMVFKVPQPGVFMYHCAPGGHAIPMHVLFGQYGMMVVRPKKQYKLEQVLHKKPDVEIYLIENEYYASGKDAIDGNPMYVAFNGKLFRYVEDPIKAKPGDYVRIYFLNVGPNLLCTFHIVGILWDYVYWQGNPDNMMTGGQTVTAGPADSWVMEFRMPPDEGSYYMLNHAVGPTDKGAIGLLNCDRNAQTPATYMADGIRYSDKEMNDLKPKIKRIISPFEPGTPDVDPPHIYSEETKEVTVHIIGNSYSPKVLRITKGTVVKWINDDIFTEMSGEFGGIHTASSYEGPVPFNSPLLSHADTFAVSFNTTGNYKYLCTPHPYMRGVIEVVPGAAGFFTIRLIGWLVAIILFLILVLSYFIFKTRKRVLASL